MKNIKAAVFDLDGTLLDSMHLWSRIDYEFLAKRGIEVPDDYMLKVAHLGGLQTAVYTKERFGLADTPEELIAEWQEMAIKFYSEEVLLKDGALEYLISLKNSGVKLAVATANAPELYLPALERTGIRGLFDVIVNVDEVERKKGFPDVYLLACERLGVSAEETAVFEDIYLGVKGAKDGGFYTVAVYDSVSDCDRDRIAETADLYIRDFGELKEMAT